MHVVLVFSVLIVGIIIYSLPNKQKIQKRLSIWGGLNLFLYGALRSTATGTDVLSYVNTYKMLPDMSFASLFTVTNLMISRDPIFFSFLKVLTFINEDPQFMLMIISAIVAISFSIFVYKNSINPLVSFMFFICLRYYSFTLSGLRQAIAWSIVMFSYELIKNKKPIKFVVLVFIASCFHLSAIFFILAYPLANIKKIEKVSAIVAAIFLLNFVVKNFFLRLLIVIPILKQYENYVLIPEEATTGATMLFIYVFILIFAFVVRKIEVNKRNDFPIMYNLSITGFAITLLAFNFANIFRIGYYYILPIVLLLPSAINDLFDKNSRILVNLVVVLFLVAQFILLGPGAGTENYQFFWEYNG